MPESIGFMNDQGQIGYYISLPSSFHIPEGLNCLSWSPDGTKLSFVAEDSSSAYPYRTSIYVIDANGLHLMKIEHDDFSDINPKWSPDGKKIAFASIGSDLSEEYNIFFYDLETQQTERITTGQNSYAVAWSADSQRLAFLNASTWNRIDLGIMELANDNNILRIIPLDVKAVSLEWSPETDTLLFVTAVFGNEIYSIKIDGTNLQKLAQNDYSSYGTYPNWYKDHKILYYELNQEARSDFFYMNFDGSEKTLLHHWGLDTMYGHGICPVYRSHSFSQPDLIVSYGFGNLVTSGVTEPIYRMNFQIKNIGSSKSSETQVYLNAIDLAPPQGVNEIRMQIPFSLGEIEPGAVSEMFTYDFKLVDFHAKEVTLINIIADPKNSVNERNEQNNIMELNWVSENPYAP